jgi:hypothetical protein
MKFDSAKTDELAPGHVEDRWRPATAARAIAASPSWRRSRTWPGVRGRESPFVEVNPTILQAMVEEAAKLAALSKIS